MSYYYYYAAAAAAPSPPHLFLLLLLLLDGDRLCQVFCKLHAFLSLGQQYPSTEGITFHEHVKESVKLWEFLTRLTLYSLLLVATSSR